MSPLGHCDRKRTFTALSWSGGYKESLSSFCTSRHAALTIHSVTTPQRLLVIRFSWFGYLVLRVARYRSCLITNVLYTSRTCLYFYYKSFVYTEALCIHSSYT